MATTIALEGGHPASGAPKGRVRLAALRVPLVTKLVGANLLVVSIMLAVWRTQDGALDGGMAATALAVILLQLVLVVIALRPIRDLETAVERVWRGDFRARVERSSLADHGVLRVGSMFNILLDGLDADRARMRALAGEVIAVGDRERAAIARELHDSTAQDIAALLLELSAAARDAEDETLAWRLRCARDAAEGILEHVRALSQSVHPTVLQDLGLDAALRKLARDQSHGSGIDIALQADEAPERLPQRIEAALYRVAHEAIHNAARHASPARIRLRLFRQPSSVTLEVHDDGSGFDLERAERPGGGMGLLCMRERVALVDGSLDIRTAKGNGTTISATVPFDAGRQGALPEIE